MHPETVTPCPYCETDVTGSKPIDVVSHPEPAKVELSSDPSINDAPTYDLVRFIEFEPCGHRFPEEDLSELTDALNELRQLRRENPETAEGVRTNEYEIEAKVNEINRRSRELTPLKNDSRYSVDE